MNSVRVVVGQVALEITRDAELKTQDIDQAFEILSRLRAQVKSEMPDGHQSASAVEKVHSLYDGGINKFVSAFGSESCRGILLAAAIHLTLVDGLLTFSKEQWFERACQAHSWRRDFNSQRARDMKRLISSREIIEKNGGTYAASLKVAADAKVKLDE